jgi:hypothetical protein
VTPLNGVTYDMSNPTDRQQSADASLVEYTIRVKARLTSVDHDALLAAGFFAYQAVGKQGQTASRFIATPVARRVWTTDTRFAPVSSHSGVPWTSLTCICIGITVRRCSTHI